MKKKLFLFFILLTFRNESFSNCGFYKLSIQDLVKYSSNILEGKIIAKDYFYNSDKSFIHTKYTILVSKSFKGETTDTLVFIAEGGELDNLKIKSSAEDELFLNEMGTFFLSKNIDNVFELSAANQSIFKYDLITNSISNSVLKFSAIGENAFVKLLEQNIGQSFVQFNNFTVINCSKNKQLLTNPFITNLSPLTITAGTESSLTISGSGFGIQSTGLVYFANADDGGATFISVLGSNILSWSDSKIIVRVPSKAGTGKVWVKQNNFTSISTQTLKVDYARSSVEASNGLFQFKTNLVNQSQTGGYLISLNDKFEANTAAKIAYEKALSNWRCSSLVNFTLTNPTALDIKASDNTNIVRFAKAGELKPGILGITYSYFVSCTDAYWYVKEFDMVFLDTALWNLDSNVTTNNQFDFLSVATHELGHAVQLGHVIDNSNLMHYSINKGDEKRIIDINSINCTNEIISDAQKTQICGPNPFQLLNTEVCEDLRFTYYALKKPILLPNPVKDILNIEFFIPQSEKGIIQIYNSIGQIIAEPINGLLQQGKNTVQLDILNSNYGNGLFFVKFIAMNKSFVSKLIIDK